MTAAAYPVARRSLARRRGLSRVMIGLLLLSALLATLPLILILWDLVKEGASSINLNFFIKLPKPAGESGGGMAQGIVGTFIVVAIASVIGLPMGIGAGVYLAEHRGARLATSVRFLSDVLNGLPSIVLGIFAWGVLVRPFGHFSAVSGGIALGAMMLPLVTRATEEMVRTVPTALGEAALALGYARWRTSLAIVLRTALPGIMVAALVAIARIAGETAPLLFTALGNEFFSTSLSKPIDALPLRIYHYGISPYDAWHKLAWAAALVLITLVLIFGVAARYATRSRHGTAGD